MWEINWIREEVVSHNIYSAWLLRDAHACWMTKREHLNKQVIFELEAWYGKDRQKAKPLSGIFVA
jgi:hypothetical protein